MITKKLKYNEEKSNVETRLIEAQRIADRFHLLGAPGSHRFNPEDTTRSLPH